MELRAPDPPLSDGDIRLVPVGPRHVPGLASVARLPEVIANTYVPSDAPADFAERWVETYEQAWLDRSRAGFGIEDGSGAFLGLAGFVAPDLTARQAEAGYILAPAARGRGVATRALGLLAGWGFGTLGLQRIELRINDGNASSEGVARRSGFRRDGVLRSVYFKEERRVDLGVWSRLPTDPPPA